MLKYLALPIGIALGIHLAACSTTRVPNCTMEYCTQDQWLSYSKNLQAKADRERAMSEPSMYPGRKP